MSYIYNDEDNGPMNGDLPLPYQVRTWSEMMSAWEELNEQSADCIPETGRAEAV